MFIDTRLQLRLEAPEERNVPSDAEVESETFRSSGTRDSIGARSINIMSLQDSRAS